MPAYTVTKDSTLVKITFTIRLFFRARARELRYVIVVVPFYCPTVYRLIQFNLNEKQTAPLSIGENKHQ